MSSSTEQTNDMLRTELKRRIELLTRGILPPEFRGKELPGFATPGYGTGPQGKSFFIETAAPEKMNTMISVPVFPPDHHLAQYALKTTIDQKNRSLVVENGSVLKTVSAPRFLSQKLSDGTPITDTPFMMHCHNILSASFGLDCKHFKTGNECRYCEVEPVGKTMCQFPGKETVERFVEIVSIAKKYEPIHSLSVTSGSFAGNDQVLRDYIELLKALKERVDVPVHFQHEPVNDLSLIAEAAQYADSVGILLEFTDENIRKRICPGKSGIPREQYFENWREAVKQFGRGKVLNTCILGFGEDLQQVRDEVTRFAEMGVTTIFIFVRPYSAHLKGMVPSYLDVSLDDLADLHLDCGRALNNNGLKPRIGYSSGSMACLACTANIDASSMVE